jgi:L-lactate dehydrogenase complex protein LldG
MSAREEILASVRRALSGADTAVVPVPEDHRQRSAPADVVELFAERVADYRAVVERSASGDVLGRIVAALGSVDRVLVPPGLPWSVPREVVDSGFSAPELDTFAAVVTGATLGIAETGTIVLTHGPGQGHRALSLVPDLHVCVVRTGDIVPDVPAAVRLLDPQRPQTWISGPSATSDIELTRVEGVHGPRTLHVIIAD